MGFFDIEKKSGLIFVYRIGAFVQFLSLLGWILLGIYSGLYWGDTDLWKRKTHKLNNGFEKWFYLIGWIHVIIIVIVLVGLLLYSISGWF